MKRTLMQVTLVTLLTVAGVATLAGQLPSPASPGDELPNPVVSPLESEPPVVALVESILAGEDDPVAWAALEVALTEDGQAGGAASPLGTDGAESASLSTSVAEWAREFAGTVTWTPEIVLLLGVVGLLAVAGAAALVGTLRRRRVLRRPPRGLSRRSLRPGRRRSSRSTGAACRDAARLEARLRHRSAA